MEASGIIVQKFVKHVNEVQLVSNEMRLPSAFCNKFGDRIPNRLFLKFRNGYKLPVVFDSPNEKFIGLDSLFDDFDFDGGEMLVFEYYGARNFNVYIIGRDFAEIEYPAIVHHSQKNRPRKVTLRNGGLKFVKFVTERENLLDEIDPPASFKFHLPINMPRPFEYIFSNGKTINGTYHRESSKFSGLRPFCEMLGRLDLGNFNMFLFSYEETGLITVSAFDDNFVETMFPGTPLSPGVDSVPVVHAGFKITVQPFHMERYCYGVDISTDYKELWFSWFKTDYISVYSGERAWRLQIRHRSKWERTAIHDGWLEFRDSLGLEVGDTCVFECPIRSYHHFSVRVIKNVN